MPDFKRPRTSGPISREAAKGTARRLLAYTTGTHRLRFAAVCVCIIISAIANVRGTLFIKELIDKYITPMLETGSTDFGPLLLAILHLAALYAAGILATYLYNYMMASVSQGVLKQIRDDMFTHMQKLPIAYFDTHTHGDIMSRYTNDTDALRQMISQSVPQIFSTLVTLISVFISMLFVNVWLTVFVVLFGVFMVYVAAVIGKRSGRFFFRQQESLGKINGYIEEMIEGQKVVKVFNHENQAKSGFNKLNGELFQSAAAANTFANILMPIMMNLGNFQYVLLAVIGGGLAIHGIGGLTLGSIAAFLQLSRSFTFPLSQMSQQLNFIAMAMAGAERIFQLLDEKPEQDEGYVTLVNARFQGDDLTECAERTNIWAWKHPHQDGSVTYTRLLGDVRFEAVDFGYRPDNVVLHEVNLYAEPGHKLAFVGATGAGKTTITNLINRFYDIQDGKIRYDGINIQKIRKADLRRSLGMVLQDTHLFTGTIRENIRYGKLDATDEEVAAAAQLANADGFISMMPDGYNTLLTDDGAELSQGQRQLLSIARAAVADPPVLILDEATSSIDTRTEAIVQQGMDALMTGRTVFVIAHRLSTVKNSNVILLLDHGRIVERGSHNQLLAEKGRYYQLYTGAFELE